MVRPRPTSSLPPPPNHNQFVSENKLCMCFLIAFVDSYYNFWRTTQQVCHMRWFYLNNLSIWYTHLNLARGKPYAQLHIYEVYLLLLSTCSRRRFRVRLTSVGFALFSLLFLILITGARERDFQLLLLPGHRVQHCWLLITSASL